MPRTELYAPAEYWQLSDEERENFRCGPGRGILETIVPEFILGICITPACAIHDYMYREHGITDEAKSQADRVFLNNLVRLIEDQTKFKPLLYPRLGLCYVYYKCVKSFGGPAFWKDKNKPEELGLVKR